jgi:hypothetical protein
VRGTDRTVSIKGEKNVDIRQAIDHTLLTFKNKSTLIKRETWQGLDVKDKPEMATHELVGHSVVADLQGRRSILVYKDQIRPDLPWADDHFAERVSGEPLNPPPSEAWWPHAASNEQFKEQGIFSHTYPERFWPKAAGSIHPLKVPAVSIGSLIWGIRYPYGDYGDLIRLLVREPYTRQAYLPIWFPEDTGNVSRVRTPCTLGYHFLLTGDRLDITYYIRSCDLLRHFRNDVYFAIRLLLHVLEQLGNDTGIWAVAKPGTFRMHISSLHCFRNDWLVLFPGELK